MADNEQRRTCAKTWDIDAARRRAGIMLPAGLAERATWLGRLLSQYDQRWRDTSLLRGYIRLSGLPAQGAMLSKDIFPQDSTQYL